MQFPTESNGSTVELSAVQLPADRKPSLQFVVQLQQSMLTATRHSAGIAALQQVLPPQLLKLLVQKVTAIVDAEPTLLEVSQNRLCRAMHHHNCGFLQLTSASHLSDQS